MKNILLIFLLIQSSYFIMCQDEGKHDATSDMKEQKYFDVIIGGSPIINFSGFITYELIDNKMSINDDSNLNILNQRMMVLKIGISVPFSFFYYINNNVAIGFTSKFGFIPFNVVLLDGIIENQKNDYYTFELLGNTRFGIKFGGYNSKFLIETGVLFDGVLNLYVINKYYGTFDNHLLAGPEIFLGWDLKTKKGFSFILGGGVFSSFGSTKFYYSRNQEKSMNIINVGG
jgi:hypothetical protein